MKIIKASAGSGKTYRLAYEYIHTVVETPARYRSVLAVTFTNKATEEMKSRVVGELDGLSRRDDHPYMADLCRSLGLSPSEVRRRASEALTMILHDYSRFGIMTIDRFFQKIVRGFVRELDLQSDYGIDLNTDYLLSLAVDSFVDSAGYDEGRRKWVADYIDAKIAEGKGRDVKKELADFAQIILGPEFDSYPKGDRLEAMGRYLSLAFRKSRVIPERMREMASEALSAINDAGLGERDFARKSQGVYGYLAKIAFGSDKFAQNRYVTDAKEGDAGMWKGTESVRDVLVPVLKSMSDLSDELTACRIMSRFSREYLILGDISAELDTVLRNNNTMILSLTDSLLSRLTRGNDAPFIYEKSGTMFDTFLIDEFQDTSTEQWGNFAPLINDAIARTEDGRESVVIVGDTKQSIYRWRGGDWRLIEGSLTDAIDRPEVVTTDLLDTNYRSRRNIIRFNNSLMRSVVDSCNGALNGRVEAAFDARRITAAQRDGLLDLLSKAYAGMEQGYSSKNSDESGSVVLRRINKEKGESVASVRKRALDAMVADIERLQDAGYSASEMAILVRTTKEARTVASYLLDYKRENPHKDYCYEVVSSEALSVGGAPVVRFVLAAFGLALNGDDRMSLASFNNYLGRDMSCELGDDAAVIESLRSVSLEEAFELLCRRYSLGDDSRGVAYLQAFHSILLSFSGQAADIPSFMEMWSHHGDKKYIALPEGQDSITVQTIHKAKGLQYKVLLMPFASWELGVKSGTKIRVTEPAEGYEQVGDLVISAEASLADTPFAYSYLREDVMNVIESVNTLYVALTRAVDHLVVNVLPDANGTNNVGALIDAAVTVEGERAFIRNFASSRYDNDMEGTVAEDGSIRFGSDTSPRTERVSGRVRQLFFDDYTSVDYTGRLNIRLGTSRYLDEGGAMTPRSYGVRMHRLFERARTAEDIYASLDGLLASGEMDKAGYDDIKVKIDTAFESDVLREMFSGGAAVYCERNILLPQEVGMGGLSGSNDDKTAAGMGDGGSDGDVEAAAPHLFARPDRVVALPDKTYLLDYKFGARRPGHDSQMRRYIRLLERMGYPDVRGWLWYVVSGEMVEAGHDVKGE